MHQQRNGLYMCVNIFQNFVKEMLNYLGMDNHLRTFRTRCSYYDLSKTFQN